jgi:predicted RNase H-like nuclease (RuvC/YqgF family)
MKRRVLVTLGGVLLFLGTLGVPARAQEPAATNPEIERLKAQLAAQQEQIEQLRRAMEDEKKVLDEASRPKPPSLGQVASTTPVTQRPC